MSAVEGRRQPVGPPRSAQQEPAVGRDAERSVLVEVKVRSGRRGSAYSVRSSSASKPGAVDSFLVRWKVVPRRTSSVCKASRPICIGRATSRRRWSVSCRTDQRVQAC